MFKYETELSQYIYTFYFEIDWGSYYGWESWQKLVSGSSFIQSLFPGILDDTIMKLSECGNLLAGEYSVGDLWGQFVACIIVYQAEKKCA